MGATGSLALFIQQERKWLPQLLPAAIVFGGGVPRDMLRLSQLFNTFDEGMDLAGCLAYLIKEDVSAGQDMLLQNQHLSDEAKQAWLQRIDLPQHPSKAFVLQLLADIAKQDLAGFVQNNPCSAEVAKVQFHRLRSLVRGMAVKGYIYQLVSKAATPQELEVWPEQKSIEDFFKNLEPVDNVSKWLARLEPLRAAIFNLSQNPLMVWENLNSSKKQAHDRMQSAVTRAKR